MTEEKGYHYTESGLQDIWLMNGFEYKETPFGRGVSIDDVDGLHNAIGLRLAAQKAPLQGAEVRFLRHELDLSQKALADLIGVGEDTIARWENNRGDITPTAQRLISVLYRESVTGDAEVGPSLKRLAELDAEVHRQIALTHGEADEWSVVAA